MNKKQLVTAWLGIALIIFFASYRLHRLCSRVARKNPEVMDAKVMWGYAVWIGDLPLVVSALAVGLTCTLANKKKAKEKMNKKQLVIVWVGAALIIFFVSYRLHWLCTRVPHPWGIEAKEVWNTLFATGDLSYVVAALAVALMCTCADKKPKDEQKQ